MVNICVTALAFASTVTAFSVEYANHFGRIGVNATYDYVVVGGGIGGLVMATRLAESNKYSVAVIEAGGFYQIENGNLTMVPATYQANLGSPSVDWNFQTTVQPQAANRSFVYNRGKTLGGTSALNAMLYQRGTTDSYATWANLVGEDSYTFDNFLPYFQKSSNYTAPNATLRASNASVPEPASGAYIASGGPLHVTHPNYAAPFSSYGQIALNALGMPTISDFSSGKLIGSAYCPLTIRPQDQTRGSSQVTYLQSIVDQKRSNLKVYTHTLAKKILFDGNHTATGVEAQYGKTNFTLSARREVILSAGAMQSPQMLMVSGIGPKAVLEQHNITVLADRPGVGQNLQDHVLWGVEYESTLATYELLSKDYTLAAHEEMQYLANQSGILTNTGADYLGWEKLPAAYRANLSASAISDMAQYPADWPELEFVVESFLNNKVLPATVNWVGIQAALIAPTSRGSISIASADAADPPVIDVGWLTTQTDQEMAVQAIKRARAAFAVPQLKSILVGEEAYPGTNVTTDSEILEWAKAHVQTVYHASCTCSMGKVTDPMAVLDSSARVIGVNRLRVVDISSFPILVPGHPQSTVCEFRSLASIVNLALTYLRMRWPRKSRPRCLQIARTRPGQIDRRRIGQRSNSLQALVVVAPRTQSNDTQHMKNAAHF